MAISNVGIVSVRTDSTCATVLESNPKKKHGANPNVCYLRANVGTNGAMSFIRFATPIDKNAEIVSATLTITAATNWGPAFNMRVHEVTKGWNAGTVTWATQPTVGSPVTVRSVSGVTTGAKVAFDVTNHVKNFQTKPAWYGFRLYIPETPSSTVFRNFYGNGTKRPTLTITYKMPVDKPTNLVPGSDDWTRIVYTSTALPTYSAVFDPNTDTAVVSAVQLELTTTFSGLVPNFSGAWNSGWRTVTTAEYISSLQSGTPSLVSGTKYAWRIKFRSNQGKESPWSDGAVVQYAGQSTVDIASTTTGPSFGNLATNPSFEVVHTSASDILLRRNVLTNPNFSLTSSTISVPVLGVKPAVARQGGGGAVTTTGSAVTFADTTKRTSYGGWPKSPTYSLCINTSQATSNDTATNLRGAGTSVLSAWNMAAGKTYTASAYVYQENVQTGSINTYARGIRIDITAPSVNGGVKKVGWNYVQAANSIGVQRISTTFTLPADTTNIEVYLVNGVASIGSGGSGTSIWFDDMMIEESPKLLEWFGPSTKITSNTGTGNAFPQYVIDEGTSGTALYSSVPARSGGGGPITTSAGLGYITAAAAIQNSKYTLTIDPLRSVSNDTSVYLAGTGTGSMSRLGLVAGNQYTFSSDVYLPKQQTGTLSTYARRIRVNVVRPSATDVFTSDAAINADDTLTRVSVPVNIPSDATDVTVQLYNGAPNYDPTTGLGGQTVNWDNFRISQDTSTTYVDGNTQGWAWTGTENQSTTQAQSIVYNSTPEFSWTVTGGTQKYIEAVVEDPYLPEEQREIWTSGRIDTDSQSISIPPGVITQTGKPYRFIIRMEDTLLREPTYNSTDYFPVYAEDSLNFIYYLDSSIPGPTSLTTALPNPIHVELTWTVSDEPNFFEISRDGVIIASDLIPEDWRISDRTYKWRDWSTKMNSTSTWEVRSVVSENTSASNPTATRKVSTSLLWLSADSFTAVNNGTFKEENLIAISGEAPAEFKFYEKSEIHEPLNAPSPVKIVDVLGGRQGSVSGILCGECVKDGKTTSAELEKRMQNFRNNPNNIFYLHLDNVTIPVILYNISTFPMYGARFGKSYGVTFDFFEVR